MIGVALAIKSVIEIGGGRVGRRGGPNGGWRVVGSVRRCCGVLKRGACVGRMLEWGEGYCRIGRWSVGGRGRGWQGVAVCCGVMRGTWRG